MTTPPFPAVPSVTAGLAVPSVTAGPAVPSWPAAGQAVVDGRRLALHRRGYVPDGGQSPGQVPVLLVHGLSGSGGQWADVAVHLPPDRALLAPDLPGFGGSEREGGFNLSAVCATMAALALVEVDRQVDVVGHGWGATIAIALAALRPELVRRLVVISGGWPPWLAAGPDEPAPGMSRWQQLAALSPHPSSHSLRKAYHAADPSLTGTPRPERSLVLWGTEARRRRPRLGEKVVSALGRFVDPATVAMVTLPGVGDEPHRSAPELVGSLLCEFLRAP